jgi:hypothetical protein
MTFSPFGSPGFPVLAGTSSLYRPLVDTSLFGLRRFFSDGYYDSTALLEMYWKEM